MDKGSGGLIAKEVCDTMTQWPLFGNSVIAMSFDTASTNTGRDNGACKMIENNLGKQLLNLACRHHIFELVLGAAFKECFKRKSVGPEFPMFQDFKSRWQLIDQTQYQSALVDDLINESVQKKREEIKNFVQHTQNQTAQPRADYAELLELELIYLDNSAHPRFKKPGAMHNARWMAKAIYCLKMYLFRNQLENFDVFNASIMEGLRRFSMFVILIYIPAWYSATMAVEAPNNNLKFIKALYNYFETDRQISLVTYNKFALHLWYLSNELVCLALFDDKVPVDEKKAIVTNFKKLVNGPRQVRAPQKTLLDKNPQGFKLRDFVDSNSLEFFRITGVEQGFLTTNPSTWDSNAEFLRGRQICVNLRVVNDTAERGVKLAQEYYEKLTRDDENWQDTLLLVSESRKGLLREEPSS